ncbi:MAG: type II toxin-antitoxin system antitoxin, RelB/DinJ family [Mailhella sp.]|nr:type II toxin-antitoxin system antitoxin, RelB/DinJ family [Mailhella sp.]
MPTSLQIRLDENLRSRAQEAAESKVFDLPSVVKAFPAQMVRENRLPYRPTGDPFYSEENQRHLEKVLDDARNGRNCSSH